MVPLKRHHLLKGRSKLRIEFGHAVLVFRMRPFEKLP